jgi:hypothetical protein
LYTNTRDLLVETVCNPALPTALNTCFGGLDGAEYEAALTVTGMPSPHWFAMADYRVVVDTSSAANQPAVLTHVVVLRVEARY